MGEFLPRCPLQGGAHCGKDIEDWRIRHAEKETADGDGEDADAKNESRLHNVRRINRSVRRSLEDGIHRLKATVYNRQQKKKTRKAGFARKLRVGVVRYQPCGAAVMRFRFVVDERGEVARSDSEQGV